MADNENMHPDLKFSLDCLRTGGLVEMSVFADEMMKLGYEKVQISSCDAVALCMLAAEALDRLDDGEAKQ